MPDAQWAALSPLLPPQRPPARDHRMVLSAILWVLRTMLTLAAVLRWA